MTNQNTNHFKKYEQKIINGLDEIKESNIMFIDALEKSNAAIKELQEGIVGLHNALEEAEKEIEVLKSSSASHVDSHVDSSVDSSIDSSIDSSVDSSVVSNVDSSKDEIVKKDSKFVKKTKDDKITEDEIHSDLLTNNTEDEITKESEEEDFEYEYIDSRDIEGERIRGKTSPLFSRRDRNRLILLSFFLGMFVALFRALIDGWPIIVWPPYNDILIHENSLVRRSIRWFLEDFIGVYLLDFDPVPYDDEGSRSGNDALTIPRKYRGKNADLYHG